MRPSDLKSAQELGSWRPHGHKMRYMAGCRCWRCRKGNSAYEAKMQRDRVLLGPNDLVSTAEVRKHLLWLQGFGYGHKTIGKVTGVSITVVGEIIWHGKKLIRRRGANKILALKPSLDTMPRQTHIDPTKTLAQIRQLTRWGIPRTRISKDGLGSLYGGLQVSACYGHAKVVAVKTAKRIDEYFGKVMAMRAIWKRLHGQIPRRHYVYWKPGRHGMTVRSFELRPFAVTWDYNNLYPQELREAMQLQNELKRKTRRSNGKEQADGLKKPPVRDARSAQGQRQTNGHRPRHGRRQGRERAGRDREGRGQALRGHRNRA